MLHEFESYRKRDYFSLIINKIIILLLIISYLTSFINFAHDISYKEFLKIIYFEQQTSELLSYIFFFIILIVMLTLLFKQNQKILESYKNEVKNFLYKEIFSFYPEITYYPNKGISLKEIPSSIIIPEFDFYYAEDLIEGMYKSINIQLSEIILSKIYYNQRYVSGNIAVKKEIKELFKGIIFIIDYSKVNESTTIVIPNKIIKLSHKIPSHLQRVKLEDPIFENKFDVYSDDQIESRLILTPAFMERLNFLSHKGKLSCCFENKKIYLCLERDEPFLSTISIREKIDYSLALKIIKDAQIFFDVVDILKIK